MIFTQTGGTRGFREVFCAVDAADASILGSPTPDAYMQESVVPAFRLLLLRHARSGWALPGQRDFERALDDVGFAEAELTAQSAADHGFRPDLILCSTAVRCRQTAEPLYRALGEDIDIRYLDPLYTGPASVYADLVAANASRSSSLMLIGHNPMMEELFHRVLGEERAEAALAGGYPPAALAVIDFTAKPGAGTGWTAALSNLLIPAPEEVGKG
ncbi:phosphohistidine phosphatase [Sinorhizobium medicae]|nr:phosphohistidine phosphatase [Sinorhizobium medicae]TWA22865.1 phosphohistidine phosphatase [Sinorhizobium medicae]TWA32531.1 phosphohistidine phosphatase [Sinorhizobium medicae]TWA36621.1 phosphohistidine phosphatase [Sinorhizobium medicae]TWA43163.1 phosphohistidine phosphatase [Sinorhizobium medicae]